MPSEKSVRDAEVQQLSPALGSEAVVGARHMQPGRIGGKLPGGDKQALRARGIRRPAQQNA